MRIHHDDDEYKLLQYSNEVNYPISPLPPLYPPSATCQTVAICNLYKESPHCNKESPHIIPHLVPSTLSLGKQHLQAHLTRPALVPNSANVLIVTDKIKKGAFTRATSKYKVNDYYPNE